MGEPRWLKEGLGLKPWFFKTCVSMLCGKRGNERESKTFPAEQSKLER